MLRIVWFARVGEGALADLRRDTFSRLVRLPMAFHHSRRVGELASRIDRRPHAHPRHARR